MIIKKREGETNQLVSTIPNTQKVLAVFDDGESYPVICWNIHEVHIEESDGTSWDIQEIIGCIIADQLSSLQEVDSVEVGNFSHYVYGKL